LHGLHSKCRVNFIKKRKKRRKTDRKEEKSTHPITQITAPIRDKTKATRAKGNPIKKPKGLQSPIIYYLLLYLSFFRCKQGTTFLATRIYTVFGERKRG
jgi:hypothetical protein